MSENREFRSGYVALIGRPNVGKSTLLNSLLGEKLSIVTPKAQTTRNRITGILTGNNYQIIFLDTPGIFDPAYRLQQHMVSNALRAASESDLLVLMAEAFTTPENFEKEVYNRIKELKKNCILVINKVDLINKDKLLPLIEAYYKKFGFEDIIPISALKGDGVKELLDLIIKALPVGGMFYPEEQISDLPERFFIAEIIREKLLMYTQQEIPYSTTVQVEEVKERKNGRLYIRANIYVERPSQKGIVIGKNGKMLKKIGQFSRIEIEKWMEAPVYLDLWVGVKQDWRKKERELNELGY
ncbi:GTPase Era [Candidatus Poribacteria bacterium]|nr:GTPase Era [Candidatus Poribacteria bacterium]